MTVQTKTKFWKWGFALLPPFTLLVTLFTMYAYCIRFGNKEDPLEFGVMIALFIIFSLAFLIAQLQLFLSLRILWFKKETCDEFSHKLHLIRFWVSLVFFVPAFLLNTLQFAIGKEIFDLEGLLTLANLFLAFAVIINLVNFGRYICTKIPHKPKPEEPEGEKPVPSKKYRYELEKSAFIKWTSIVLVVCLLLLAGYLFGYDYNQPIATPGTLSESMLSGFVQGDFTYSRDMETIQSVVTDAFEGVVHYSAFAHNYADARGIVDTAKEFPFYKELVTHYTFSSADAESVLSPCFYTPLVKKWGYGWYNKEGNLLADALGEDTAKDFPNYRRHFVLTVRKDNIVWRYSIFTNQTNQFAILNAVREFCNAL